MSLETRTTQITVLPEGEPIFSQLAYSITIEDEAAGEYVLVRSANQKDGSEVELWIGPDEWPTLRDAIDRMIAECRPNSR